MGTRAAAFAGKISNLREHILRIQNGTMPQPTCVDLANMMKYFCQVLHDFRDFKDIENVPLYAHEKRDRLELMKSLPTFEYCGLYKTLSQLVDILPLIPQSSNGLDLLGSNLLMLFKCLVPFLDQANMETMPYLVATLFMSLPATLHKDILDTLCYNLLPFTIDQQQRQQSANNSKYIHRLHAHHGKTEQRQKSSASQQAAKRKPVQAPVHCIVKIEDSSEINEGEQDESHKENMDGAENEDEEEDQGIGSSDGGSEDEEYALLSVTSILMIAFHYITEPMHHSQLIECLMKLKPDVFEDLLYVIAYGTTRARCPAVEILFRYWPDICPSQQDGKNNSQANKLKHVSWQPTKCQNKQCSFTTLGDDEAVKMCLDFKLSISLSGLPPPMLVCLDCVDSIYKQQLASGQSSSSVTNLDTIGGSLMLAIDDYSSKFIDLLLPMQEVSKMCENKKCESKGRNAVAVGTCFDIECANYNSKKPIRYCQRCYERIHEPCSENNYDVTLQNHIRHSSSRILDILCSLPAPEANSADENSVNNFIEAIISLLKEAAPADRPSKDSERYLRSLTGPQSPTDTKDGLSIATEEKQLISQYGIWLMTGLCKTVKNISDELLGRLLGMLFQWFNFTACLPDDQVGNALENLKEHIKDWIMGVKAQRLDVFISCLLPHPIDCSKIGGHWEVWPDTAHQIKEGFKRLLCLVPYDIITDDVWDEIMPFWMECFRHEVPENELNELKILLSKVFDPELSPLGFKTKQMYNFISSRFEDDSNTSQEQTLYWLQIITMLEIPIPIDFLFQMLKSGVRSLAVIRANELAKLRLALNNQQQQQQQAEEEKEKCKSSKSKYSETRSSSSAASCASSASSDNDNDDEGSLKVGSGDEEDDLEDDAQTATESDDAIFPASSSQEGVASSLGTSTTPSITSQREKQARARAAFSARLLQQVSLLEAQAGGSSGGQLTSPAVLAAATQPAPQAQLAPTMRAPLKSTTSLNSKKDKKKKKKHRKEKKGKGGKKSQKQQLRLELSGSSSVEEYLANRIDNNLICYILMMDILLKQLDLQEVSSHRGLEGREAGQAIDLLNAIIATPWMGRHTCCDTLPAAAGSQQPAPSPGQSQSQVPSNSSGSTGSARVAQSTSSQQEFSTTVGGAQVHSFGHCAQGFEHEDSYETCVFCEIISTFHQLAMFLIEYFAPVIEVSICEVSQEAANGEFNGKPDYSRIGLNHLGPSPPPTAPLPPHPPSSSSQQHQQEFNFLEASNQQKVSDQQQQQDPATPYSPSYSGPFLKSEVLNGLPKELQLAYNLLVQFHQYQTPDIVSQLLQMIKLLSLHSQVLSRASKQNPHFVSWCQHNMLVGKLWSLCQLESCEIARTCVPLLLHCITLPWGVRLFRDLVERDFNSDSWLSRFRAVERVVTIAYFCEPSTIKNSSLLQSTMASAFCYVVRCLDDIEAIVAQRALVSLEMMKTSSLKLLLWCLEVQFDYIIADRPMILRTVFQLYNHLRDRRFLAWEFFLNRFDTIFLEAQLYLQQTGEIPSFTIQDLKNTNTKSEIHQKKIQRAKEALQETHHSRSLAARFQEQRLRSAPADGEADGAEYKQSLRLQRELEQTIGARRPDGIERRRAQSPTRRMLQHGKSTSSRYQSVALLTNQALVKRKNSTKFMANLMAMQSVPPLMLPDKLHQHLPNSFVDDGSKLNEIAQENHVFGVVHRICDEDRDTNHSLIFLLMQFFSKSDPSHPPTIKSLNRNHQIVLRHLNILMGYSVARKNFLIPAANLRLLPVFNAFLTSLPKVLDFNYSLGTILLDTCLPVLIYSPAPDDVQFDTLRTPGYSLWLLNPLMRQSWLMSVMSFLYKYQFDQPHLKTPVNQLMWIVINTLESHLNCQNLVAPTSAGSLRPSAAGHLRESATSQQQQPEVVESPVASTSTSASASRVPQVAKVELVEPTTPGKSVDAHKTEVVAASASSASLTTKTAPKIAPQEPQPRTKTGKPNLVKADTSDCLAVKSSSSTSSSKLLFQRAKQPEQPSETPHKEPATSDERLLPIGLTSKSRQNSDLPHSERLLPIGAHRSTSIVAMTTTEPPLSVDQLDSTQTPAASKKAAQSEPSASTSAGPQQQQQEITTPKPLGGNRRRFGGGAAAKLLGETVKLPLKDHQDNSLNSSEALTPTPTPKGAANQFQLASAASNSGAATGKRGKSHKAQVKEYQPPTGRPGHQASGAGPNHHQPYTLLNEQLALVNRHSLVQEFSDKDLSMCLVILETFIHHEPSMAAQMLPNILRLVARYSSASLDSWQSASNAHLVGGSMFVARQFIRVALHDLMDNNIFHQIFTSHFTGYEFYKSMATALADFPDLNQLAPLSRLFEDLNKQKNLPPASTLMTILENVATYFECIIGESTSHSLATWTAFINNWENFLRKLILALPRYSGDMAAGVTRANDSTSPIGGHHHHHQVQSSGSNPQQGSGGASTNANQSRNQSGAGSTTNQQANANLSGPEASGGHATSAAAAAANASAQAIPSSCSMIMSPIIRIILSTSKISHLASCKTIVDPYSKIISYTVLHSQFKYEHLLEINHNCCRLYTRDREKYLIQRTIAYELVQVLKFRFIILEENLLILLLFALQDVGGCLAPKVIQDTLKIHQSTLNQADTYITNVSECLRQYIGDLLEFITDVHAISRINDNLVGSQPSSSSINRDSFGGHVKAAISQYLALEMSLSNGGADQRTVSRYLPWLYTSPSLQQGPREFIDCVSHIRQLSWVILGSLQHSTLMKDGGPQGLVLGANVFGLAPATTGNPLLTSSATTAQTGAGVSSSANANALVSTSQHSHVTCQPIPIEKNGNIAEHVQVILAGFAEQSKESVLHMSGLFHAFLLCQLWTMYCENICTQHPPNSEQYQFSQATLDDFWAKITPGVLRLVGHSRVMSEMVSTHFLQLIESLIESNSSILIKYLPLWNSVFYAYKRRNKSSNLAIRLQKCIEWQPPDLSERDVEQSNKRLINWLEKVQYKMSHIEIQSSQAAPFYLT